jgi:hypothetical protein
MNPTHFLRLLKGLFFLGLCCANVVHAAHGALIEKRKNRDGAVVFLMKGERGKRSYEVYLGSTGNRPTLHLVPAPDSPEASFFSVKFLDLNGDGFWDIEKTNACGNKVCERFIFVFDPAKRKFVKFFDGAYGDVLLIDGYLVASGASGCCNFEHQAYKVRSFKEPLNGSPNFVIAVSAPSEERQGYASCVFTNDEGAVVNPPSPTWNRLCEVFGEKVLINENSAEKK